MAGLFCLSRSPLNTPVGYFSVDDLPTHSCETRLWKKLSPTGKASAEP